MTRNTIPVEDYPVIVERRRNAETLQAIADTYGVSRERIRQVINATDDSVAQEVKEAQEWARGLLNDAALNAKLKRRMEAALKHNRKCRVCGAWVLRGNYVNCSPEHSEAWTVIRAAVDLDEHRRYMAQTYLNKPGLYKDTNLNWARRVMAGEDMTSSRKRYLIPGSKASETLKKYRPDLYEQIAQEEGDG